MQKKSNTLRMLKQRVLSFTVLFVLSSAVFAELSDVRKQELEHLIKHDCGSCHGMTLKGGLGPSLHAQALKNKTDELLFVTISEGRPGTPMPPWKPLLSKEEINLIIKLLRSNELAEN